MSTKSIKEIGLPALRPLMRELTIMVDGKETVTTILDMDINSGALLTLIKQSAAQYQNGDVYEAVMQLRTRLSSYHTNMKDKIASGEYFPDSAICSNFFHKMWDYTDKLAKEFAPTTSATSKYGKAQWQCSIEDIDGITSAAELQKVINSLNDVCSPEKFRPAFEEFFGEDYLNKAKAIRVHARAKLIVLKRSESMSTSLADKLNSKGKITLTAADLDELRKLIK